VLQSAINYRLNKTEEELGVPVDYIRHIGRHSVSALIKFSKLQGLIDYRRKLPKEAHFVCRLVAAKSADCGSCVQIEVNLSRKAGISTELIKTVVEEKYNQLSSDLQKVVNFTRKVLNVEHNLEEARSSLLEIYGEEAVMELCLTMSAAQFFPTVKRGLGYSVSCSKVEIEV